MYRREGHSMSSEAGFAFTPQQQEREFDYRNTQENEPGLSERVKKIWLARGILVEDKSGDLQIDQNALRSSEISIKGFDRGELLNALSEIKVASSLDSEKNSKNTQVELSPLVCLPSSTQELYEVNSDWSRKWILPLDILIPRNIDSNISVQLGSGETVSLKLLVITTSLNSFGARYNPERSEHENNTSLKVLAKLSRLGIIQKQEDGNVLIDKSKLLEINMKDFGFGGAANIIEAMSQVEGLDIEEYRAYITKHKKLGPEHLPAVAIPRSISEMHPERGSFDSSIIPTWDLGAKFDWDKDVILESGEIVNIAEIAIAYGLKLLDASRDQKTGQLMITTKEGKRVPFRNKVFLENTGINPRMNDSATHNRNIDFAHYGKDFLTYLPRLKKAGILRYDDFFRFDVVTHDFNVAPKTISNTGDVAFSSEDGLFARYYLGKTRPFFMEKSGAKRNNSDPRKIREGITNKDMLVYRLTDNSAGIFVNTHDRQELVATFEFPSKEVLEEKYKEVMAEKGLDRIKAAPYVRFNKDEMARMIKPYRFLDGFTRWPDETDAQFVERTARLNRPDFVVTTCQDVFHEAGIGLHKLEWQDQLKLADAILDITDREKLVNFAKKYKIAGLKVLSSLNQTRFARNVIFDLEDKYDQEVLQKIFQKYAEILDTANQLEQQLSVDSEGTDQVLKMKQGLADRGRKLLEQSLKSGDHAEVLQTLELMDRDLLVLAQLAKQSKENPDLLKELQGFEFDVIPANEIQPEVKIEMEKLYAANKNLDQNYDSEHGDAMISYFRKSFEPDSNKVFHIYSFNGKMIGYFATEFLDDNSLYAGSLNVNPESRGPLSKLLVEELIEGYGEKYNLMAEALKDSSVERWYLQTFGFERTGKTEQFEGKTYNELIRKKTS